MEEIITASDMLSGREYVTTTFPHNNARTDVTVYFDKSGHERHNMSLNVRPEGLTASLSLMAV